LGFVGIADALALDLGADRNVARRFQIGRNDLAQTFSSSVCRIAAKEGEQNEGKETNLVHAGLVAGTGDNLKNK
jgi:hypothetical protein